MNKAQILNRVYATKLPSRAKTVMFYLINRANKELTCFPAVPTIARETGMIERTAFNDTQKEIPENKQHVDPC